MNLRTRLLAAALAALSVLAFGACSETNEAKTPQQLNPPLGDNEVFTALVAQNNSILGQSQLELETDGGGGVDPDVMAFATKEAAEHGDALTRLVGTSTISYSDGGFPDTAGLGASAGLTLTTNRLSISNNNGGANDVTNITVTGVGSVEPGDCAYLANMVARHTQDLKFFKYLLVKGPDGGSALAPSVSDGGVVITNSALGDELIQEQAVETAHLKKAKKLNAVLTAAPSTTPLDDGGVDPGGPCYVAPAQ